MEKLLTAEEAVDLCKDDAKNLGGDLTNLNTPNAPAIDNIHVYDCWAFTQVQGGYAFRCTNGAQCNQNLAGITNQQYVNSFRVGQCIGGQPIIRLIYRD